MAVVVKRVVTCDIKDCDVQRGLKPWGALTKEGEGTKKPVLCARHRQQLDVLWRKIEAPQRVPKRRGVIVEDPSEIPVG